MFSIQRHQAFGKTLGKGVTDFDGLYSKRDIIYITATGNIENKTSGQELIALWLILHEGYIGKKSSAKENKTQIEKQATLMLPP